MSTQIQITFDAHDPRALSAFWAEALGYLHPAPPGVELPPGQDGQEAWDAFLTEAGVPEDQHNSASALEDPEQRGPRLYFQRVPEGKTAKNRLHLDLRAAPGLAGGEKMAALEEECARLVGLGASRLERHEPAPPMSTGFIVMADPEGNEFCLD
ncbi:VOC family protein [Nesterenkonia sphaerica]|uniref:VOC family protein n=1 Tax=Nesterenkonia sphaerica TaxID=1804988 RepID=A0A5R9AB67_9MICC|nr:VOC family protein [Nesterenkonia sphaerica]TLP75354.1 VOC family protein [Nesterenkonia sphaerica]